jgi:hypothetical protein
MYVNHPSIRRLSIRLYDKGLPEHDKCAYSFHRAAARAARAEGFAVYERGEIERRLLYASQNKEIAGGKNEVLRFKMHLDAPAPEIVSTGLLALIFHERMIKAY